MSWRDSHRKYWILDDEHNVVEVPVLQWATWYETADRHVSDTETKLHRVSTVFLGLDHRFYGDGPPLLFETMTFDHNGEDCGCWRYASWDDAVTGHAAAVRTIEKKEAEAEAIVAGLMDR